LRDLEKLASIVKMVVWLELDLARVRNWDREKVRKANANNLVELATL